MSVKNIRGLGKTQMLQRVGDKSSKYLGVSDISEVSRDLLVWGM